MKLSIHNGRVIDPGSNNDRIADILIEDGSIAAIGDSVAAARTSIDATGQIICPGLVELSGNVSAENLQAELTAACAAGITTLCLPTPPSADIAARMLSDIKRLGLLRPQMLAPMACPEERLAPMHALRDAGCIGVSDKAAPIVDTCNLKRAMEYALSCDLKLFFHPVEPFLSAGGVAAEGEVATRLGLKAIPAAAEAIAISRVLALIEDLPVAAHFCRISGSKGVKLIAEAKASGMKVTADTGIAHLCHDEHDMDGYNTSYLLSPPLRGNEDKLALRQALAEGVIDALCSDHHFPSSGKGNAPFPIADTGMETWDMLLPGLIKVAEENSMPLTKALAAITAEPAAILGIEQGKIREGADADLCILDASYKVTHTICAGNIVYQMK